MTSVASSRLPGTLQRSSSVGIVRADRGRGTAKCGAAAQPARARARPARCWWVVRAPAGQPCPAAHSEVEGRVLTRRDPPAFWAAPPPPRCVSPAAALPRTPSAATVQRQLRGVLRALRKRVVVVCAQQQHCRGLRRSPRPGDAVSASRERVGARGMAAASAPGVCVEVVATPLSLERYVAFVSDDAAGAIATFIGVTRDSFEGKRVLRLEYEAYEPMARVLCMLLRNDAPSRLTRAAARAGGEGAAGRVRAAARAVGRAARGHRAPHGRRPRRRGVRRRRRLRRAPPRGAGGHAVRHRRAEGARALRAVRVCVQRCC